VNVGHPGIHDRPHKHIMAAITYAYEAFYCGCATPTQLYYVDLADKALAEVDRIRDLTDAVNREKLRNRAIKLARSLMADGDEEDLDEAIIGSYRPDTAENCAALFAQVERLATPPEGALVSRLLDLAK
jgi:hypothetical protein